MFGATPHNQVTGDAAPHSAIWTSTAEDARDCVHVDAVLTYGILWLGSAEHYKLFGGNDVDPEQGRKGQGEEQGRSENGGFQLETALSSAPTSSHRHTTPTAINKQQSTTWVVRPFGISGMPLQIPLADIYCCDFHLSSISHALAYSCARIHPCLHSQPSDLLSQESCLRECSCVHWPLEDSVLTWVMHSIGRFIMSIFSAIANVLITIVSAIVSSAQFPSNCHDTDLLRLTQTDLFVCIFTCGKSKGSGRSRRSARSGL